MLTKIEQEFEPVIPRWIQLIDKHYENREITDQDLRKTIFTDQDMRDIMKHETCVVGDVRSKLGLPLDYFKSGTGAVPKDKNYCYKCMMLAASIYSIVVGLYAPKHVYLESLTEFKDHLKKDHWLELSERKNDDN